VTVPPFGTHPAPPRPDCLPELLDVAERLSARFDFVRVDFYIDEGWIYAGEITHCSMSAAEQFGSLEEEAHLSKVIFG